MGRLSFLGVRRELFDEFDGAGNRQEARLSKRLRNRPENGRRGTHIVRMGVQFGSNLVHGVEAGLKLKIARRREQTYSKELASTA
jgi:hypothetical protein